MIATQKKEINLFFLLVILFVFLFPLVSHSAVKVTGIVSECDNGAAGECTFNDLISAVQTVVNWGTTFAIAFSVVVIAYSGFEYMRYADNPGKRSAAGGRLLKVVIGMFFIIAAWVIVTMITGALGVDPKLMFLK
jgi:hypothetical protein